MFRPRTAIIQVLHVTACGLSELDGLAALPQLKELYAAYNADSSLEALMDADALQILDLQGNHLQLEQLDYLGALDKLQHLNLLENPCSRHYDFDNTVAHLPCPLPSVNGSKKDGASHQAALASNNHLQAQLVRDSIAQQLPSGRHDADDAVHVQTGRCANLSGTYPVGRAGRHANRQPQPCSLMQSHSCTVLCG